MFSITEQVVKVTVTVRTERNGTDRSPAMTLHFSHHTPNDVLSEFGSDLKSSLYRRPDLTTADMADQADPRNDDPNYMPKLRNPQMKNVIELDHEIVGAEVTVNYGTGGKSNIVLDECNIEAFKADCQEGGTVFLSYDCLCHPSDQQAGKLYSLHCREVTITIKPPAHPQVALDME